MARKYTKNDIEEVGTYEIRLHDIDNKEFIKGYKIEVFLDSSSLYYTSPESESECYSLSSLYEEYLVYQRKVN